MFQTPNPTSVADQSPASEKVRESLDYDVDPQYREHRERFAEAIPTIFVEGVTEARQAVDTHFDAQSEHSQPQAAEAAPTPEQLEVLYVQAIGAYAAAEVVARTEAIGDSSDKLALAG